MDRSARPAVDASAALDVRDVTFGYGATPILTDFCLEIPRGQIVALLGASGCGKSTLLKLVAGLLVPSSGLISIMGQATDIAKTGFHLVPEKRNLGMVFQDYALWPHMSVGENVEFPLRMASVDKAERRPRVESMLARVGLAGFAQRRPSDLSGGQQQRVALARAMVGHPSLVLFDEPLSNLDRELRSSLAEEIADLLRAEGLSGLYVTHDQSEAFSIADTAVVMSRGNILQKASPQDLVRAPASAEVAEFMALGGVVDVHRRDDGWYLAGTSLQVCPAGAGPADVQAARLLLRPDGIRLTPSVAAVGTVCRKTFTGAGYRIRIRLGDAELTALCDGPLPVGTPVDVDVDPRGLTWFA
jgi:iron(III) transport system ATP-binding protein